MQEVEKTILCLLHEAIASEQMGAEFYSGLAERATRSESRELYQRLAEEEEHHEQELQDRYDELMEEVGWEPYEGSPFYKFLDHIREELPFLNREQPLFSLKPDEDPVEAVRYAREAEQDAVNFFLNAALHTPSVWGKEFFIDLARFEMGHVRILDEEIERLKNAR